MKNQQIRRDISAKPFTWIGLLSAGVFSAAITGAPVAAADEQARREVDKSRYTIFDPTPPQYLREFETDRPDITESPFTIDAGHVQTETDIVNYRKSRPDENGAVKETILFGSTNVRVGVTNNAEVDFLLQPFNAVRTRAAGESNSSWRAGPDVFEARAKFNIYGNDSFEKPGATAVALLPFVDLPTVNNGVGQTAVEGGLIVPFAIKLTEKIDLSLMTEFDWRKNEDDRNYHVEYVNTASLSYEFTKVVSSYVELATTFGNESPFGPVIVFGTGLTFKVKHDLQFDVGMNVGLSRAADRLNPFFGMSKRF
jgi:hypothetical protein